MERWVWRACGICCCALVSSCWTTCWNFCCGVRCCVGCRVVCGLLVVGLVVKAGSPGMGSGVHHSHPLSVSSVAKNKQCGHKNCCCSGTSGSFSSSSLIPIFIVPLHRSLSARLWAAVVARTCSLRAHRTCARRFGCKRCSSVSTVRCAWSAVGGNMSLTYATPLLISRFIARPMSLFRTICAHCLNNRSRFLASLDG